MHTSHPFSADTRPGESMLHEALNLSSDGVIVYEAVRDDAGGITDYILIALNDAAAGIFELTREEVTESRIKSSGPTIEQDIIRTHGAAVVQTRQPYHTEVQRTSPSGVKGWFDVALRPYQDGFAITYHDITAAKEALLHSESQRAFYEELMQQSMSRKAVLSPLRSADGAIDNFRYDYANYGKGIDDVYRRLPLLDIQVSGSLLTDVLPSVKESPVWAFYCALADTTASARAEFHYNHDGLDVQAEITGNRLHDGRLLVDIAEAGEARRLAAALDVERSRLDGVFQAVPLGLTVFESVRNEAGMPEDLRLVRRNEKALEFSRIPAEKYRHGALLSDLMPKELYENFERMLHVARTGEPLLHELYQPHLDVWISSRVMKYGDGLLNTIQDITEHKRHVAEMQQQATMLEGVLQASPHAILVFEAVRDEAGAVDDFRIIRFNHRAVVATATPEDKLRHSTLFTCIPSLQSRLPQYVAVMEGGEAETYEYFNEQLGLWRRITNTPLGDGFVMTMEDITGQRQASQKIADSANLLNAVLDTSPIAIVVYEAMRRDDGVIEDFRPIIVNRQALEISAFSSEEFLRTSFFERNPASRDTLLAGLAAVVTERKARHFEHQVPSTGRWVTSVTTPFGDGFIATSQDITEHKEQTRIIEEQAALFNGVLSSLQNGLSILQIIRDGAGELEDVVYIEIADSIEHDTGFSRADMKGCSMRALYPGIEQTDYWKAFATVAKTGQPVSFETHFTLPGYDNYLLNWVTPIGTDKLVSVYYIVNDLKRAQRELEHTVAELRRSNSDLEQFASVASHDLQEPLRKVQSFGNMLEQRYAAGLGEGGSDLVRRMQLAAGRMRDLVTGLLDFASLSRGKTELHSAVNTERLLREIMLDLDHSIDAAGGRVRIEGSIPNVLGVQGQMRHLFHNLLTNAIKFHKPDVPLNVTIRATPIRETDASHLSPLVQPGQYVRIEITDNGIGFDPLYADKIFGLFERLHGMSEYQGTGIGLSICRRVTERHDGAIRAESVPGVGSTFIVLLPKA